MHWISVTDRYPPDCESVLIWAPNMTVTSAYLIRSQDGIPIIWQINDWDEHTDIYLDYVTHWMPLPEPPTKVYDL